MIFFTLLNSPTPKVYGLPTLSFYWTYFYGKESSLFTRQKTYFEDLDGCYCIFLKIIYNS